MDVSRALTMPTSDVATARRARIDETGEMTEHRLVLASHLLEREHHQPMLLTQMSPNGVGDPSPVGPGLERELDETRGRVVPPCR